MLLILVFLAGCASTPQVNWSPDGKTALYHQNVLDPGGKKLDELGPFDGAAVWSANSSSLYFIGTGIVGPAMAVTPLRRWVDGADADKDVIAPKELPPGFPRSTVYRRRDGKNEPLITFWEIGVQSLAISSDQQWLLIQANGIHGSFDFQTGLMAYQLQSKKLYVLSTIAGPFCFIGTNRVAFVDNNCIYQTTLDESLPQLVFTPLLSVLPNSTSAIAGSDKGLLVQTAQATFPSSATQPVADRIYAVTPDGKQFRDLATVALGVMSLGPDGKHILFIRTSDRGNSELAMMNVDGTQPRMLMDLSAFKNGLPLMPTWHGNDRITFASATGTPLASDKDENKGKLAYDVVDYTIPATGPMQPVQILSQTWKPEMKPSRVQFTETVPTTMPAGR